MGAFLVRNMYSVADPEVVEDEQTCEERKMAVMKRDFTFLILNKLSKGDSSL